MRSKQSSTISGVAIIVVLFAVALVSIVVLAYFNLALLNRNISFSSAGQTRANIIALSALDCIKGDFIAEIQSGSTQEVDPTGANVPIYVPTTNTTMVPYRMTTNVALDPTMPYNLVKWSSGTFPLWPNTAAYNNNQGPIRAFSGISTTNASVNGHFLTNSLWTKPYFSTNSTFPASVTPAWVYMTRQGPLTNTASPVMSTLANSNPTNSNYVIGRYAYTVYDEGGLLDVAAAGYSMNDFSSDPTDVGRKGSQGFADLTQFGLSASQIDKFVKNWRNLASATSAPNYLGYLTTNAPASGFMRAATNDQAFVSRQDFIEYWTNSSELNASPTNLPYLTTFSREKNAPSWGPEHDANDPTSPTYWNGSNTDAPYDPVTLNDPSGGISYAYHTGRDNTNSDNRFFPNVRVKTTFSRLSFVPGTTTHEQAVVGEPLVKNRFDLSKLAWISYTGLPPVSPPPVVSVTYQDIYNYFGLIPNFSSTGVFLSWTYNHTSLTFPGVSTGTLAVDTTSIMTLDQVASLPANLAREPDFFELLQAALLRGSLGLSSGSPTPPLVDTDTGSGGEFYRAAFSSPGNAVDEGGALYRPIQADIAADLPVPHVVNAQAMFQIIQIGANMIDQADNDNFPTEIVLDGEHFFGIENLPYISAIGDAGLRIAPGGTDINSSPDSTISNYTASQAYVHRWLDFALWNPHQNATNPPTLGPTSIRIAVVGGPEYPYIVLLGKPVASAVGGTDYSGRTFEVPGTPVSVPSPNGPANAEGPAWIAMKLSAYNNFPVPTAISYANSYTSDNNNPGSANINDPDGRISTTGFGNSALAWQRAGIYLGWSLSPDNPYKVPACISFFPGYASAAPGNTPWIQTRNAALQSPNPLAIYLQYEDVNHAGTWHTYEELPNVIYSRGTGSGDAWMEPNDPSWASWLTIPSVAPPNNTVPTPGKTVAQLIDGSGLPNTFTGAQLTNMETTVVAPLDPRATRYNLFSFHNGISWGMAGGTGTDSMLTSTINLIGEPSKGFSTGLHFQDPANPTGDTSWSSFAVTWIDNISISPLINYDYPTSVIPKTTYYRDRDYIPRVGDAAGWTNVVLPTDAAGSPGGASPLTTGAQMQRPLHLDRPFRSVAELGYVFRDDPWKTLNLISANSADAGLLDVFYVGSSTTSTPNAPSPDVIAGKMNINSAALNILATGTTPLNSPVLQALISQTVRAYDSPANNSTTVDTSITTASDIKNLSTNIVSYIKTNGPLFNIADLPGVFPQVPTAAVPTPLYTGLKNPSEALTRALADSAGTRTWNLMIDVVAQAGKFSPTAANLNNFTVEGEKHYWLHVAIDRFTGEIVDQQLEPVWE